MIRKLILGLVLNLLPTVVGQAQEASGDLLGQGPFQFRVVQGWAAEALKKAPLNNGHALAFDSQGRLFVLTDEPKNNVLILDPKSGELLDWWTAEMPGAHGMALVQEDDREVLYVTDTKLNEVRKLSLEGKELARFPWPEKSGLYSKSGEYRPSKSLHHPQGGFWVLDGYGKDYVHHYSATGSLLKSWGGNLGKPEDQIPHWGPHGGALDLADPVRPLLVIAMSDRLEIKRFTLEGHWVDRFPFPGGNPRDVVFWEDYILVPHLADNWPEDRQSHGFVSILDRNYQVVSNVGAAPAVYEGDVLQAMKSDGVTFLHPHAVAMDSAGNLYVAQFASPAAPLLKLERVR